MNHQLGCTGCPQCRPQMQGMGYDWGDLVSNPEAVLDKEVQKVTKLVTQGLIVQAVVFTFLAWLVLPCPKRRQ